MSGKLVAYLRTLKKKSSEIALRNGEGNIDDKWLFSAVKDPSLPLNYRTWRRDVFYPTLAAAKVRRVRIHDLDLYTFKIGNSLY